MRTRVIPVCVLFALGSAACGSGSGSSAPPNLARDLDTAKKLNFVATDFPAGWTSKPDDQTQSPQDMATSKELNDCVGTSGPEAERAKWDGDEVTMGQYQVSSEANLVTDKAIYRKDVDAIKGPKLSTCVKDVFTKRLTTELQTPPTSLEVTPLKVAKYGDVTVGLRLKVDTGSGTSPANTIYVDQVLMGKDRAEVTATLFAVGQPIDPALEKSLLAKLGARVGAA